jgi:exosortase
MQLSLPNIGAVRPGTRHLGWCALAVLVSLLWAPVARMLVEYWRADASLSHGPLVVLLAAGLVWSRREELRAWDSASGAGLALLCVSAVVHVAAMFASLEFFKPLSLLGVVAGVVWFLGGWKALNSVGGALGLLVFTVPWPTTVIERLAFPMQMTSSAYAALFGGLLGLPIVREGVHLFVVPDPAKAPVYAIMVAKQCSGLTSLMVLLALGYLIAYFTPVGPGWRALMVAAVVPIALFNNAVRLTLILVAGTYWGKGVATWVHDNEAPVLVALCSIGLMLIRYAILSWTEAQANRGSDDTPPQSSSYVIQEPLVDPQ